jgi:hypothetical protein
MTDWALFVVLGLLLTILILLGTVLSLVVELRCRNIALARVVAPDKLSTPSWDKTLAAIAVAMETKGTQE